MLYITLGTVCFESISKLSLFTDSLLTFIGFLLVAIALLFKLGAFPFHV
jgi:NADH:ubiquinone oxidoreductase subunit 2 (subunit N)